ncbi:MAG TPA: phage tail protein [Nitrosopumilaceae archaeon]|nr:phage tail protein [Nitrosopumilaceae archaeon]
MKRYFSRTVLIVLLGIVFVAGAGTAYAGMTLPTITLGGNVDIIGDLICTNCVDHTDIVQIGSQQTIGKLTTGGSGDCIIGEVRLFSNNIIPRGFLPTEGQTLQIVDYTSLFSVIGIKFGGNGNTDFKIPDLRNVEPTHRTFEGVELDVNYAICAIGVFPSID